MCEKCKVQNLLEKCEHTYKLETNETHHWNLCSKCQTIENESFELHSYEEYTECQVTEEYGNHRGTCTVCKSEKTEKHEGANHENNGQCTKCRAIYERHNQSEEIKEYKITDKAHRAIYKCTNSSCEEIFEGEEETHNLEEWTDNENGTHSAICTICNNKQTEKHNENCIKCKKSNLTSGFENNVDIDNTVVDKEIPKAGIQNIILNLTISVGVLIMVTIFKMKKYKDI